MGMGKWILVCVALLLLPLQVQAAPAPLDPVLSDVANDDGSAIGITWAWDGAPAPGEEDMFALQVRVNQALVDHYALTEQQMQLLEDARSWLAGEVKDLLPQLDAAEAERNAADEALTAAMISLSLARVTKQDTPADNARIGVLRHEKWSTYQTHRRLERKLTALNESFAARTYVGKEDLRLRALTWEFLKRALQSTPWVEASSMAPMNATATKADRTDLFGVNISNNPDEAGRLFTTVDTLTVPDPQTPASSDPLTGLGQFSSIPVKLVPDIDYQVRMITSDGGEYALGTAAPIGNAFDKSKWNNLLFAIFFSMIILTFIILARRNPNMFIRRIAGLEAVDEAIGRATEMGKPVLYLTGMQSLSELPTLAAINILGRVAGKIADYESDLIVPNRDPVVQTVAQEVVKEGYLNAGRPDAYREDNIFFLTDDQFSFTAATCGIMMREKPAAIFLMGYYYAESLLLAETGAETGAIQIAGTDSEHQLPFFIVTCDYTLIGEELYAASAYLSREPMLLGSLKGQDVAKGIMLLLILLQSLLFIFGPGMDFLKDLVTPLN